MWGCKSWRSVVADSKYQESKHRQDRPEIRACLSFLPPTWVSLLLWLRQQEVVGSEHPYALKIDLHRSSEVDLKCGWCSFRSLLSEAFSVWEWQMTLQDCLRSLVWQHFHVLDGCNYLSKSFRRASACWKTNTDLLAPPSLISTLWSHNTHPPPPALPFLLITKTTLVD